MSSRFVVIDVGQNFDSLSKSRVALQEIGQLEQELGMDVADWQEHWSEEDGHAQVICPLKPTTKESKQMMRSHSRRLQTQITMEMLDKVQ